MLHFDCQFVGIKMMLIVLLMMKVQNQGPYMEWSSPLTLMHEWPSLSTARLLRSSPMGWHCKDSCMFNVVWTDIYLMSLQNKVATDLTYCDVHLNVTHYGQRKHVGCELGSMHWLLIGFWDQKWIFVGTSSLLGSAPLRFGHPEFKSRLTDLSQSHPPSLSPTLFLSYMLSYPNKKAKMTKINQKKKNEKWMHAWVGV